MARGVNKVILVGNLGNDPEQKAMPSGNAVTNITVATSESWKDKQTGEKKDRVEWHRVVFFNRLAEIAGQYLRKGAKVYIEGSLRTRKWQDQNGNEKYTTEIVASEMQMLDGRQDNQQQQGGYQQPQQQPPQQQAQQNSGYPPPNQQQAPQQQQNQNMGTASQPHTHEQRLEDFDDDIPF